MKWQYFISEDEQALPQHGEAGWELVAVLERENRVVFYFKKPVPSLKERLTEEQRRAVYQQLALEETV